MEKLHPAEQLRMTMMRRNGHPLDVMQRSTRRSPRTMRLKAMQFPPRPPREEEEREGMGNDHDHDQGQDDEQDQEQERLMELGQGSDHHQKRTEE